jgi:hypothetical protein
MDIKRSIGRLAALGCFVPLVVSAAPPFVEPVDVNVVNSTLSVIATPAVLPRSRLSALEVGMEVAAGQNISNFLQNGAVLSAGVLTAVHLDVDVYGAPSTSPGQRCIVRLALGLENDSTDIAHLTVKQGQSDSLLVRLPALAVQTGDGIRVGMFNSADSNCHLSFTPYLIKDQ